MIITGRKASILIEEKNGLWGPHKILVDYNCLWMIKHKKWCLSANGLVVEALEEKRQIDHKKTLIYQMTGADLNEIVEFKNGNIFDYRCINLGILTPNKKRAIAKLNKRTVQDYMNHLGLDFTGRKLVLGMKFFRAKGHEQEIKKVRERYYTV